jgi:hypothetical protein
MIKHTALGNDDGRRTDGKNANFIRKVKRLYAGAEERTAHPKQLSTDCQIPLNRILRNLTCAVIDLGTFHLRADLLLLPTPNEFAFYRPYLTHACSETH